MIDFKGSHFEKEIILWGTLLCRVPEKITIEKSGANTAAIESYDREQGKTIELRQSKYLNNIIEQDHRAVKRIIRPMLGFKSFWAAQHTLAGIEVMHMIRGY